MQAVAVDVQSLPAEVRAKYRQVAVKPDADYQFHTGRPLAAWLGYDGEVVAGLSDAAVESFAGSATRSRCEPGSAVSG